MQPGFTLAEVLAALAVLAFGLTAVIGLVMGSMQHSQVSGSRHAAMILIPEAVRQIEMEHLITADISGVDADAPEIGMFIETLEHSPEGDEEPPFSNAVVAPIGDPPRNDSTYTGNKVAIKTRPLSGIKDLSVWPHFPDNARKIGGASYRVLYRLEKHPEWWPHTTDGDYTGSDEVVTSPYRGTYLLTLACYKTSGHNLTTSQFRDKFSEWVQVTDPIMVVLRDRKVR